MFRIVCLSLLLGVAGASLAQLKALHPYNGINRPFDIEVTIPRGERGDAVIQLLTPGNATVAEQAAAKSGRQDLATLFPTLWTTKSPRLLYAQLTVGGKKVGPALVLQPMLNPMLSRLAADGKTVEFVPDEDGPMYNGIRAYVDQNIVLNTEFGDMEFRMRPDAAPNTVWNLMQFVKDGLYTNTIWHRVVAKRADGTPFVIQGGDPTGTGSGGPGFAYPLEKSTLEHTFGVISIARSTDPNTNGCQFFVCLSREGTQHLDGRYAAFGECIRGTEAILKTAAVPVGKEDRPLNPPKIYGAKLVDAMPYGEGPAPVRRPN